MQLALVMDAMRGTDALTPAWHTARPLLSVLSSRSTCLACTRLLLDK